MHGVDELANTVFSGLSPLVVEDVTDEGERIRVRARTPDGSVACPGCAVLTLPYHNGGTEGESTKTKRIMLQMHDRAGFTLLRHRILMA
jgi:hypothetical protein